MRRVWCLLCVSGLLLGAGLLRSGEQADLHKIVDQAIKAAGGREKLSKYKAATLKGKGIYYGLGTPLPYTGEWALDGKEKLRFTLEADAKGKAFKVVEVVNGKKSWMQIQGKTMPMKEDQLREEQEEMYAGWLTTLVPLKEKGFKLSAVGEVQVNGKPAVGVRVERQGRIGVSLFFDKQSHRLVKSEFPVKDVEKGGQEMMQEVFYKDYKAVQGIQQPTKILINRDGKRFVEAEMTEIHMAEHLDDSVFKEP